MKRRDTCATLMIAILLGLAAGAAGQDSGVGPRDEVWAAWTAHAIESVRAAFESRKADPTFRKAFDNQKTTRTAIARGQADARHTSYVAVREASLEQETAATSLDRLTFAFRTDVADAEAGLSVAPAVLFGSHGEPGSGPLDGLSIIVASLKEAKTRVGLKWAWASATTPKTPEDIGLALCPLDEAELRADLLKLRSHFDSVCSVLVHDLSTRPAKPEDGTMWNEARAACGAGPGGAPRTLTQARNALLTAVKNARSGATADQLQAIQRVSPSLEQIDFLAHPLPLATACYDPKQLRLAFRKTQWRETKVKAGILSTADFFRRSTGFNPDPTKQLPRGQNAAWLMQAEASFEKSGFNLVGSLGWARSRAVFDERMYTALRPTLSASFVLARLDGQALRDKEGVITFGEDGSLPPLLVAGFLAKLDYASTRPESQTSSLNSAEFQVFLDFRINEKLSFRLGVPYRGDLAVRKANSAATPPITERRDLQWTFPVFLGTVIKM